MRQLDEIRGHGHVSHPGPYVGAEAAERRRTLRRQDAPPGRHPSASTAEAARLDELNQRHLRELVWRLALTGANLYAIVYVSSPRRISR